MNENTEAKKDLVNQNDTHAGEKDEKSDISEGEVLEATPVDANAESENLEKENKEDHIINKPVSEKTQVIIGGLILLAIIFFSFYRSNHVFTLHTTGSTEVQAESEPSELANATKPIRDIFKFSNVYAYEPLRFKTKEEYTLMEKEEPKGDSPGRKRYYCSDSGISVVIKHYPNDPKEIYTTLLYTTELGIKERFAKEMIPKIDLVHKDDSLVYFGGKQSDSKAFKRYTLFIFDLNNKDRYIVDIFYIPKDDGTPDYYYDKLIKSFKYKNTKLK